MKPLLTSLDKPSLRIKRFITRRTNGSRHWWTPVWRGLTADPESRHRKRMGSSLWLYLYLLTYTNRKTGFARRKLSQIRDDTGYPTRTIQRHLKQLKEKNYITAARSNQYLHIKIKRWKSFTRFETSES